MPLTPTGEQADMTGPVFHLAIPTQDLDAAPPFYRGVLEAEPACRYADRQTVRFVGHQLACHLAPEHQLPADPLTQTYPRHFGMTPTEETAIETIFERCRQAGVTHLSELSWRFDDRPERHRTLWTADPAGNVLAFQWYQEPRFIY